MDNGKFTTNYSSIRPANILSVDTAMPTSSQPSEAAPEKSYQRKFPFFQRLFKVLFSPAEGMKDVALAPTYGEIFAVLAILIVLTLVDIAIIFTKIQFVGLSAFIWGILTLAMAIAVVFVLGVIIAFWLVKSLIVKVACDKGSGWSFKTAASITGYAHLAHIILGIVGIMVLWLLTPSVVIDVTNQEAAMQAIANLQAQMGWARFWYAWPVSILVLVWESYLGALGAHFGTGGKCSFRLGFLVFFCIGLVGLLISHAYSMLYLF
jgi:hypothetical protein